MLEGVVLHIAIGSVQKRGEEKGKGKAPGMGTSCLHPSHIVFPSFLPVSFPAIFPFPKAVLAL
jgi:hypothetical protein